MSISEWFVESRELCVCGHMRYEHSRLDRGCDVVVAGGCISQVKRCLCIKFRKDS